MFNIFGLLLFFMTIYYSGADDAVLGSTINLICPSLGPTFSWNKQTPQKWEAVSNDNKYSGVNTSQLTIRNIDVTDSRDYLCYGGTYETISLHVIVYAACGSTVLWTSPFSGTIYQWQKYGRNSWIALSNNGKYTNVKPSELTILNVDDSDNGQYRCSVDNIPSQAIILNTFGNGGWSIWGEWVACSVTCGIGTTTRYRTCTNPPSSNGCSGCVESNSQTVSCNTGSCAVNGQWSDWGVWTTCTMSCGGGKQYRFRYCNSPSPANGGSNCTGSTSDTGSCNTGDCPVNGQWSEWGVWTTCSFTCGNGTRKRFHECNKPAPSNGGSYCQGLDYETESCNNGGCTVNGLWGTWGSWTACSVTCGDGNRTRYHDCNSPAPANGGSYCIGLNYDTGSCNTRVCPVNGGWSTWGNWTTCNVTCGGGIWTRQRYCNNPAPSNGGSDCQEFNNEAVPCNIGPCPEQLESSSIIGPVAGGVSGGIVAVALVVVIVVLICVKRRKDPKKANNRKNKRSYTDESSVTCRQDLPTEGMYINIGRPSLLSSSETDEDSSVRISVLKPNDDCGNTYYNVEEIITIVKVEKLKEYIAKKKINDGLKEDYKKIPNGMQHPTTKAELKDNMQKNRFKTTFPYDHTRVILETVHGTANSDYINANYVDGFEKDKCYIASQGPLKQTVQDHWRMIWQNNTRKIVMLTNLVEGGKPKCDKYWPTGGKPMTQSNMVLTLISEKERAAYITREISVEDKKSKEKRSVIQYHFTAWPDHGTPDPLYLVLFHKHFRADHSQIEGGPILVHCSAGIGRTGTFIALDALLEEGRSTGYVDIVKFVRKMRYCRMNMIQTADQYVCLHHALLEAFTMDDTSICKEQFGLFWREIQSDKRPINQQKLNEEFKKLHAKKSEHENVQYADATSTENIDKNRNRNVLAMDDTRLYLVSFEKGRSNYINAVQVPSYTKFVGYLTTQLPLPDTTIDFWTMIRDHNSSTIVLILNDLQEANMVYSVSDDLFICGPFSVKITRQEKGDYNITEATLVMTKKDEKPREISLFQTICKDRPNTQDLCRLYNLISTRISMSNEPVTVVSCDGAKNCGLFCTFTNAVSSIQIDGKADIFQLARLLQLRRTEFFSDFEEYRLCYEALNFYLESTNVYDNLAV